MTQRSPRRTGDEVFEVVVDSPATRDVLFRRLADIPRWHEWAGPVVRQSVRERDGRPDPDGVGAIRRLGSPGFWGREEITEVVPPLRHSYILLSGMPVRRYGATVELEANGSGGTTIRWRARFAPRVPGTGPVLRLLLRAIVAGTARRLATVPAE